MMLNTIKNIDILDVLDIFVVAYIFYRGYMLLEETRAMQLLKGVLLLIALIPISYLLNLRMVYTILIKTITIGVLSIIIIFQPEIRRALEHLGRSAFNDKHVFETDEQVTRVVNEIVTAVVNMAEEKTGALIAIELNTGIGDVIASGTNIDAIVSSALLENIFVVNTPLHDGATIIRNDRIVASGCVLPLTSNNSINKKLGTRHRAALGLSEISDAILIIVSEETGIISLAVNGRITRNYDEKKLKDILTKIIKNRRVKVKTIGERVRAWTKEIKIKTS